MNTTETSRALEDYHEKICRGWLKTVQSILELATTFAEAEANLDENSFEKLLKGLPFSRAKMSMLRQIGGDKRLYQNRVIARLPASYSTIYQVHLLHDDELERAIESGLLQPDAKREHIERVRLKRGYTKMRPVEYMARRDEEEETPPPDMVVLGELLVPRNFKDWWGLHEAIMSLVKAHDIEFVPRPGREARRLHQTEDGMARIESFVVRRESRDGLN